MASAHEVQPSEVETWPDFKVAAWPRSTGQTNRAYEEMLQRYDECLMYDKLLHTTSSTVAMMDVIGFVLKFLDHQIKALAKFSPTFESRFIGGYAKKPFQDSTGENNITYVRMLKFTRYLEQKDHFLAECQKVLDHAENKLVEFFITEGFQFPNGSDAFKQSLRCDIVDYVSLEEDYGQQSNSNREIRNIAAHPFTILLLTAYNKTLQEQELESSLPSFNGRYFNDEFLGRLMISLSVLERDFEAGDYGQRFVEVLPAGFLLIKLLIKSQRENGRAVSWKSLKSWIPGKAAQMMPELCLSNKPAQPLIKPPRPIDSSRPL